MKQRQLLQLLSAGLEITIRNANPWWRGEPIAGVPSFHRWAFEPVYTRLTHGLAPAIVLRGPRQVGKTTLLNQVVNHLIKDGIDPRRLFRLQFDDLGELKTLSLPVVELVEWYTREVLGVTLNQAAADGKAPFLFLDEVQNLAEWAPQLKHLVDLGKVRAMVTGSSALRIEAGHDSLAGRVQTIEMGPLLLREIAALRGFGEVPPLLPPNGLGPLKDKTFWHEVRQHGETNRELRDRAFAAFSERGAYPVAQVRADIPWGELADFLNETVVRRAIKHDLRIGKRGQKRDEHLLEEVFRLACRYIGQTPAQALYLDEIRRAMNANIGWQRILTNGHAADPCEVLLIEGLYHKAADLVVIGVDQRRGDDLPKCHFSQNSLGGNPFTLRAGSQSGEMVARLLLIGLFSLLCFFLRHLQRRAGG